MVSARGSRLMKLTACGLLALIGGLAVSEEARPWRKMQAEFRDIELRMLDAQLASQSDPESPASLDAADVQMRRQLEGELRALRHKQQREAQREASAARDSGAESDEARRARAAREGLATVLNEVEQRLAELSPKGGDPTLEHLTERRRDLAQGRLVRRAADLWPALVAIDTSLKVVEIKPPGLSLVTPSGQVSRIDRCATCHLAMDPQRAWLVDSALDSSTWPAPFTLHPRPELFVDASSPHPAATFGCTVCHGGDGRATSFARAGHSGTSSAGDRTILGGELAEARCGSCHDGDRRPPSTPRRARGSELVAALGCEGCHAARPRANAAPEMTRPGPSLAILPLKTTPGWASAFLDDPTASHRMPNLFGTLEAEVRQAEVQGIVSYLWHHGEPLPEALKGLSGGNPEAGGVLFGALGCAACHAAVEPPGPTSSHGPDLSGAPQKLRPAWLFAFLQAPSDLQPGTSMPNLRLSTAEARDLSAYLLAQETSASTREAGSRVGEAPFLEIGETSPDLRDSLALRALETTHTLEEAAARFAGLSNAQKWVTLGEHALRRHGCAACHTIPGLVDASTPRAAPLAEIGKRLEARLATSRNALGAGWLDALHAERAPSPAYGLGAEDEASVAVELLAHAAPGIPPELWASDTNDAERAALAAGHRLIVRYGCRACHAFEPTSQSTTSAPDLSYEGARAEPRWLAAYLRDPDIEKLRPWLDLRMPTFPFSDAERHDLVAAFATRDARPLVADPPATPDAATLALGEAVMAVLQCLRCHDDDPRSSGLAPSALAPSYHLASRRLRPEWVVDWILAPQRFAQYTAMPPSFPPGADGRPSPAFLADALEAPMFAVPSARLRRHYPSRQELDQALADPEGVAEALRVHLWTLRSQK